MGEGAVRRRLVLNYVCLCVCVCVCVRARARVLLQVSVSAQGSVMDKVIATKCVRAGGHIFLCVSIYKCVNAQLCGYVVSAHISVCSCEPKCAKG